MPLLWISVLVLLLLPWSLSCDGKSSPETVRQAYMVIVKTHLQNTINNITASLQSSEQRCKERLKHKTPNCMAERPENMKIVDILLAQACRMHRLNLPQMNGLVTSVQDSTGCLCKHKPTKEPTVRPTNRMTARSRRHRPERETKKLCKAKAILSSMTLCYEMLNTLLDT